MSLKTDKFKLIKALAAVLAICCVFTSLFFASPVAYSADQELEDIQNQIDALDQQIARDKQKLNAVQGDIKDNKSKLSALTSQIDSINEQIDLLNSKINVLNGNISSIESNIKSIGNDIEKINANIKEIEQQSAETDALMQETRTLLMGRIRENYMAGESSDLEVIFSSSDFSSYFARKELMSQVSNKDAEMINELTEKIKELDQLKKELEKNKADLQKKSEELEQQKAELNVRKSDLKDSKSAESAKQKEVNSKRKEVQNILAGLDEDSAEYKAAIKQAEKEKEILAAQIDEYIRVHGSSVGDTPDAAYKNDGRMAWPVKFSSYMSAGYPTYPSGGAHWGIDIVATGGNTRGRPFNAAQGGEVIIAVNDGGYNYGFGNYCVIDHGDGTQTLYAHSDNIQVSKGQIVQKGQQIGIIGGTGNVTGPHLHFEVRVKNADGSVSRVQPLNYVSNPYA